MLALLLFQLLELRREFFTFTIGPYRLGVMAFPLSDICFWLGLGVGIFAAGVTGEDEKSDWGLESERRGSTDASPS